MQALGIQTAEPQDLLSGGLDLMDPTGIAHLVEQLRAWAGLGYRIYLHLAVPCATFSPARDRSRKTRKRSPARPEGFRPLPPRVREGNVLAVVAAQLVRLVVVELLGSASLENPLRSHLWLFY